MLIIFSAFIVVNRTFFFSTYPHCVVCVVCVGCVCVCVSPFIFLSHCVSCLLVSNSATPWTVICWAPLSMGFSSKNTGVGSHSLLQGIVLTHELNPGLWHCRQDSLPSESPRKPNYISGITQTIPHKIY